VTHARRPEEPTARSVDIAVAVITNGRSYLTARPFWHHLI